MALILKINQLSRLTFNTPLSSTYPEHAFVDSEPSFLANRSGRSQGDSHICSARSGSPTPHLRGLKLGTLHRETPVSGEKSLGHNTRDTSKAILRYLFALKRRLELTWSSTSLASLCQHSQTAALHRLPLSRGLGVGRTPTYPSSRSSPAGGPARGLCGRAAPRGQGRGRGQRRLLGACPAAGYL